MEKIAISKIKLSPDDIVVIHCPIQYIRSKNWQDRVASCFDNNKVLFLNKEIGITVMGEDREVDSWELWEENDAEEN